MPSAGRALLLILSALIALGLALAFLPAPYSTEEVRFANGSTELAGTLYLPAGDGPHPAAIFIHGAGAWTRSEALFREHAERLAGFGLAMLIYDKRGCGESSGDWRSASFADLAADALAGVELLREHPRVAADGIGLFGTSQGGSIALLAAAQSTEIAFVATLSLSPLSPAEQGHYLVETALRQKGFAEEQIAEAVDLDRRIAGVYRTDSGWEEARAAVERLRSRAWFEESGIELWPRESRDWRWFRDLPMDFDPVPLLARLEAPLFAAQGEEDRLVPGPRAAEVLRSVQREHDRDFTVVLILEVGHVLRRLGGWPIERWTWPESYWEALQSWIEDEVIGG